MHVFESVQGPTPFDVCLKNILVKEDIIQLSHT